LNKYLIAFLLLFLISKSLIAQDSISISEKKAEVYIIRNDLNVIFNTFEFYNNDKFIGGLKGLQYLKYECNTGKQLFWAAADNLDFIELNIKSSDIYIIEADYKLGFFKGRVKLNLVPLNSKNYIFFRNKIQNKKPVQFRTNEILSMNLKRKKIISKAINKYSSQKETGLVLKNDTTNLVSLTTNQLHHNYKVINQIQLDYNFIDLPFSNEGTDMSGIKGLISNPSMSQSLNLATSLNSLKREGLYRLMSKNPSIKPYYKYSAFLIDILSYLPIPLTSAWMHEEFHRAVLTKHGGNSYNEMNNFPIGKTLISVLDINDNDLIKLKHDSPQDMVRMSEAGIEGEYLLANSINRTAFFYNTKSISITPLLIALNSSMYVLTSSGKNIDKETDKMNRTDGQNINKRDLLGVDFLSYTYDLFRPNEPYQNRGIHPSGVGINRYIKRSQLTPAELSYLKQQGLLQLINFINPISLMFTSFTITKKENGDDTRANLYFNHWLTSFGYDISSTGLLHSNFHNYAFTFHNYVNHTNWMPGVEAETYDYLIGKNIIKNPIPVTARAMVWLQPKDQLFYSKKLQAGGLIEAKIYYPVSKTINPYISFTAKTSGWVAGNVYLEKNTSASLGLRASF